jgi:hypothetical protein
MNPSNSSSRWRPKTPDNNAQQNRQYQCFQINFSDQSSFDALQQEGQDGEKDAKGNTRRKF